MKRKRRKMRNRFKIYLYASLGALYFLAIILIIAVRFVQQRQILRQNAAGPASYGNCTGPAPAHAQGVCFAQPNTCATQGLTQYYSETIPVASYSSCALVGF